MSSITGSRHNCEQGQPKPQLRGVHSPPQQRNHRGGAGKGTTGPTPQGGRGGYHGVGGEGGCGSPASYMCLTLRVCVCVCLALCRRTHVQYAVKLYATNYKADS